MLGIIFAWEMTDSKQNSLRTLFSSLGNLRFVQIQARLEGEEFDPSHQLHIPRQPTWGFIV